MYKVSLISQESVFLSTLLKISDFVCVQKTWPFFTQIDTALPSQITFIILVNNTRVTFTELIFERILKLPSVFLIQFRQLHFVADDNL